MSLVPLFLQVRAATPNPPSDAGSTPPPPADAGSPPSSDASPDASADAPRDASVSTDASAAPDAGTDASPPPPPADASAPRDAGTGSSSGVQITIDPSFYVAAGACYTGRGFGNSRDDYHDGGCFQLTAGFPTIRFNEQFYLRPEFRFEQDWVNHVYHPNHGGPITSSASISDLSGVINLGWQPIPYFAVEAGFLFGASYFDSHAPESGEGGTFVSNLALGVSLHNWSGHYGGVLRLLIPEQRLMDGFALGGGIEGTVAYTNLSVVPDWSDRNPNDPPVGVNSLSASVGAFLRVRFGGPSSSSSRAPSSGDGSSGSVSSGGASSSTSTGSGSSGSSAATSTPPPSITGGSDASGASSESPDSSGERASSGSSGRETAHH